MCLYMFVYAYVCMCIWVCTCVCVCVYACVHVIVCLYVFCASVFVCAGLFFMFCGCVFVYVCMCTSGLLRVETGGGSLYHSLPHFFKTGSLSEPGAHQVARLAGQRAPGALLLSPPQHGGYRCTLLCLAFYMGAGEQTWVFMLVQQARHSLSHLSGPKTSQQ